MLLVFAFLLAAFPAIRGQPTYEMLLVYPEDEIKMTVVPHGKMNDISILLSKAKAGELLAFSQRNVGKTVEIGLIQHNRASHTEIINPVWLKLKKPIQDGILQLKMQDPKYSPNCDPPSEMKTFPAA